MKKVRITAVFTVIVLLCSCSTADTAENISINPVFSAKMTLHYKGTAYTADFESDSNGCSAVFLVPEEIKGFNITTHNNKTEYSLDGLTFSANNIMKQQLPLDAVVCAIASQIHQIKKNENGYTVSGNNKYGDFIMNINNNYIPQYIEYNSEELTVKFNECT